MAMLDPLLQTAATVQALNEAWVVISVPTGGAILCLPFARRVARADGSPPGGVSANRHAPENICLPAELVNQRTPT